MSLDLRVLLVVLATWRVTHLLVHEDGPADLVVRLRRRAGDGLLGQAMDCFYCSSLWIAAPLALVVSPDVLTWFVAWPAISGAACLLERATNRGGSLSGAARAVQEGEADGLLRTEAPDVAHADLWRAHGRPADAPATPDADECRVSG